MFTNYRVLAVRNFVGIFLWLTTVNVALIVKFAVDILIFHNYKLLMQKNFGIPWYYILWLVLTSCKPFYCYATLIIFASNAKRLGIACVLLLVTLPALSGISGNSEYFTEHQTANVLEIHFWSLKYMVVFRIREDLSNFPFLSI